MKTIEEANAAIDGLNGHEISGTTINVEVCTNVMSEWNLLWVHKVKDLLSIMIVIHIRVQ